MPSHVIRNVLTVPFLYILFVPAAHAGDCLDVLIHAPYDVTDYRHESFTLMDAASTKAEADHLGHQGGAGITYEGIPLNATDINNADRQVSQSKSFRFASASRESVLIYSGASTILDKWSECMAELGGIRLRFEPNMSLFTNDIVLHIEYWKIADPKRVVIQPDLRLQQAVRIPAKQVIDSNKCLQPTTKYREGTVCDVQIKTASQWDSFSIHMPFIENNGTTRHSVSGFLPVRAELKVEKRAWPSGQTEIFKHTWANDNTNEPNAKATLVVNADPGFFILDSISATVTGNNIGNGCAATATLQNGGTSAVLYVGVGTAKTAGRTCDGHWRGTQVKFYWDPPQPVKTQ